MIQLDINELAARYETPDFIKDDPIQFPHRFTDKRDIEIAGFIASLLAYGSRKAFITKLKQLFAIAQNEPHNFICNFEPGCLKGFNYRFSKEDDFVQIFSIMKGLYNGSSLEELFKHGHSRHCEEDFSPTRQSMGIFKTVVDYFYSRVQGQAGHGFYHMIPNPDNGGAMKRMCMYLRWMVRKGPVDLGIWDFMPASELLIPLDVHVARISREMGLLKRNSNDFKAVLELTENLRKLDPNDPVKYDFAMFGYGVNKGV
ncbi:MAG: TIGR02757 family protein [Heliobacteriaceae bacterium]|nr:TIGR02757 family protein [Heliobacteriaceae bacterium]